MATTTLLELPYPAGSDPVDVAGDLQSLAEAVDSHGLATIACTSSTRPTAAPFRVNGRKIYETDTKREYVWDNASAVWRLIGGNVPTCRVSHNTSQSAISTGTETACLANTEAWDTDSMHSTASNTSRIIATVAGEYELNWQVNFQANGTGVRWSYPKINATTDPQLYSIIGANSAAAVSVPGSGRLRLAAADFVEIMAFQDSGSSLTVRLYQFSMRYVGPSY